MMADNIPMSDTTLIIRRTINAPRVKVFEAWTKPDFIKQWFAPSDAFLVPIAEVDLKVGGMYRIGMRPPDREALHIATGIYREIKPPEKLVFTWAWEGEEPMNSVVTVEFRELGNATEVMLKHEHLPNVESRNKHTEGWVGCLNLLEKRL